MHGVSENVRPETLYPRLRLTGQANNVASFPGEAAAVPAENTCLTLTQSTRRRGLGWWRFAPLLGAVLARRLLVVRELLLVPGLLVGHMLGLLLELELGFARSADPELFAHMSYCTLHSAMLFSLTDIKPPPPA